MRSKIVLRPAYTACILEPVAGEDRGSASRSRRCPWLPYRCGGTLPTTLTGSPGARVK